MCLFANIDGVGQHSYNSKDSITVGCRYKDKTDNWPRPTSYNNMYIIRTCNSNAIYNARIHRPRRLPS